MSVKSIVLVIIHALIAGSLAQSSESSTIYTAVTSSMASSSLLPSSSASSSISLPSSSSLTSSAAVTTHTIAVGDDNFAYSPNSITANIGDVVEWQFYPLNHSVVQAAYRYPCVPLEYTDPSTVGFYSGDHLEENGIPVPIPSFSITINDTNPIFYYCGTPGSCNTKGMVGVINPSEAETLEVQQSLALQAPFVLNPGEVAPSESTSSSSPTPNTTSHDQLSAATIGGIVIGVVALLVFTGAAAFFIRRSRKNKAIPPQDTSHLESYSQAPSYFAEMSSDQHVYSDGWKYASVDYSTRSPPVSPPLPNQGVPPSYFPSGDFYGSELEVPEDRIGSMMSSRPGSPYEVQGISEAHELDTLETGVGRFQQRNSIV